MSLVTGFNFRAFECDATRHRDGAVKEGVSLSVLTSEDMKRLAVCKVTIPCGKENPNAPWQQVALRGESHATFWDTSMGNFDLKPFPAAACTTCSNSAEGGRGPALNQRCSGHYGYIAMPSIGDEGGSMVVYNPIMFRDLCALLRAQCFSCHNFRMAPIDTMRWYLAFELFDLGLTAEALAFLETFKSTTTIVDVAAAPAADQNDGREKSAKKSRAEKPTKEAAAHGGIDAMKRHVAQTVRNAQAAGTLPSGKDREATLRTVVDIRNQLASQALAEMAGASKTCTHCGAESPTFSEKDGQLYLKLSKLAIDKLVAGGHMTAETKEEYLTEMRVFSRERVLLPSHQALQHIVDLTAKQTDLLGKLLRNVGTATVDVEFKNPLPPTECYKALFLDCILVPPVNVRLASGVKVQEGGALAPDERTKSLSHILNFVHEIEAYYRMRQHSTPTLRQQIGNEANIRNLQLHVDKAYEGVLSSFAKKEGLFRMHMMGKRVNQACRSVISPDFTVEPNEVLVPRPFARNLSFPEQLTFHDPARTALLRKCIINGPATYPGASHVEVHDSDKTQQTFVLSDNARDVSSRTARADAAFAAAKQGRKVIVHRHVLDGDRIVFNRQPTLHRPSMQSYEARVLSSLKTLRFHYVSGKSYNADFDGDEMNVHVPQSMECRAELATIMDSNLNYLVPTSGRPIRGLIQDHCAAGVFLTMRDRFFDKAEFMQLIFLGLQPYLGVRATLDLESLMPVPAILKPRPMWTGKQMVSVILRFVTGVDGSGAGNQGIFTKGSSMTYTSTWTTRDGSTVASHPMGDEPLLVLGSELLIGVLDKNQLGPSNLSIAHLINEVYGPHHVGRFFGALGRVLTYSLRYVGFSMGMEDMILLDAPGRRKAMREIDLCVLGVTDEGTALSTVSKAASALNGKIFPTKLRMHFPHNDLVTMTQSGAKGSNTNAIQMALTLGQQTFSGQRIGAMTSGKTAPSFFKGESRARSKGFAMGRFVSGIRPAEYTIHAMAGRDGLIDTAVKTARSGYLQRCLVKGLESLTTQWDGTVRDASGAVIQFQLGGDGLDPCKASTLTEFGVVHQNRADLARRFKVGPHAPQAAAEDCFDSDDDGEGRQMTAQEWQRAALEREQARPLPGHIDARLRRQTYQLDLKPRTVQRWRAKGVLSEKMDGEQAKAAQQVEEITKARLARGGSEPGEPVGIVAAQAAGEPSTQMTLNTFHQAGQTVTHVTEGIPRLRELLMFASVAQPAVIVPVTSTANGELEVVQTIIGRLTPKRLEHALAPLAKPYRWSISRHESGATLSIVMLFSIQALERLRKASGSTMQEHVVSFGAALRGFSKRLCMRLKGVVRQAATGVRKTVTDPAELLTGDEEGDEVHVRRKADGDDDDDDRSAVPEAANGADDDARSATPAPAGGRGADADSDDDGDAKAPGDDEDEDEDDDAAMVHQLLSKQGAGRGKASAISYTRFPALDDRFIGGSMHSVVTPAAASAFVDPAGVDKAVLDDLCAARFEISMPGTVVSVIPDILGECLKQVTFPTSNAQVAEALWLPDKGKDSGQLILQGEGAKLRTALRVVAPFAERCPGINVRGITSTDVRDIAETFGIEAAYDFLSKELVKLFKRHSVDARHCSLIADVATFRGIWHAFNFNGMIAHSSSPLFQMTFASSRKFLERAISRGVPDDLNSFSAAIMVGERPHVGTGTVGLSVDADVISATVAERPARGPKPMRPAGDVPPPL